MTTLLPYRTEYKKGNTSASCEKCQKCICEGSIQISFMQQGIKDDYMEARWFDVPCFFSIRQPGSEDNIDGFANLRYKDQMELRKYLADNKNVPQTMTDEQSSSKKHCVRSIDLTLEQQIEQQNDAFFAIYDKLKTLKTTELVTILNSMHQFVPESSIEKLNHVCDIICFGALSPCPTCKNGKLLFRNSVYCCSGYDSPWTKCPYSTKQPLRVSIELPIEYQTMLTVDSKVQTRILRNVTEFNEDDFESYTKQPLFNMEFFIVGDTKYPRNVIEHKIRAMGGRLVSEMHSRLAAVFSNEDVVNKGGEDIMRVFILRIQVISDELLDSFLENDPIELIAKSDLSKWGKDPYERMPEQKDAFKITTQNQTNNTNEMGSMKTTVYCEGTLRYEVVLDFVDIKMNKNSFCKLQLVQIYSTALCYVFETKGRISATSSGFTNKKHTSSLEQAKNLFKQIFLDLTGNEFGASHFEKKPGKYNLVKIDNDIQSRKVTKNNVPTKLSAPLYELMQLLFADEVMKTTLLAYCLVFDSMPLGKIPPSEILGVKNLLVEISSMLSSGNSHEIIGASNRFYSYFPHDCGFRRPPLINSYGMVQQKIEMLQRILDRDIIYKTLTSPSNKERNLLDVCYEHLQDSAEITMLNKSSGMYTQICNYVNNTQLHNDPTANYDPGPCKVDDVFVVERHEEILRYQPHEENFNRQLLFHGTRIENLVSILTSGLKVIMLGSHFSGSAFGKGIYFADSVTKSARYCHPINRTGLVLLCEVAAGRTDFRYDFQVSQMVDHCESVQAIGMHQPDPLHIRPDGLKIPNGKLVKRTVKTPLVFNEFVLFDESRVKIRYLVKLKFTGQQRYRK
ncbi:poly [ADP-ribose] polymerase-like [Contarinia nasturtii]|uniref:poly [ADP-ribose] polymerase-like n=1 Tax=Contarinia nasturtii TaxID=265458 RepID=UPI0012D422DE|nr:poly [ADP-ribose] polymerase-like [Contarinia nasturtii]